MAEVQWVLITGAARPTGLGYWTAKRLIADGSASVILSAKTQAAGAAGCHCDCSATEPTERPDTSNAVDGKSFLRRTSSRIPSVA